MDHLKIAYDFRFQATYAEKYFRKTIFLPVLKKELDIEPADERNKDLNYDKHIENTDEELAENMQEIDQLLSDRAPADDLDNFAICENTNEYSNNAGRSSCERDEMVSESDSLSDHFADAFNTVGDKGNIDRIENDEKYEVNTLDENNRSRLKSISSHASPIQEVFDYYYANIDQSDEQKQCSETVPKKNCNKTSENERERTAKLLKLVQEKVKEPKHSKEKIECNICGTTFTHINSLKQHLMKHSGEKPFKCEFCEKCFARKTILTIHRRLHTGDRPYRCNECIQSFVTKEALNRHIEREHEEKPQETPSKKKQNFICSICNKARCSKYSLAAHMRTHHPEVDDSSDEKNPKSSQRKLKDCPQKPRRPHLPVETKRLRMATTKYCKVCQQEFSSKWELFAHQEAHEITQIFECDVCQRAFEKKYQLLYHLQTHNNAEELIKKHVQSVGVVQATTNNCKKKPKSGKLATPINKNVNDEEDDAPLAQGQKEIIQAKSIRQSKRGKRQKISENDNDVYLNRHRASKQNIRHFKSKKQTSPQAGGNPANRIKCRAPRENLKSLKNELKCQICKKTFTHPTTLKLHMMKHTGDRPFQCEHCGKSFGRKNVLNIHRRLHTGEKPYKCPLCESAFVTKDILLRHVTKCHGDKDANGLSCETCHALLPNKVLLDNHMRFHADEKQSNEMPKNHEEEKKKRILFSCNLCGESFACLSDYTCHLDVHEPPKMFQCEVCKMKFKEKYKLLFHMQQHKIEQESCKKCGEVFTIKEELIKHVKIKHLDKRCLDFQCAECSKGLYDMRDLKEHLYEVHGVSTQGLNSCDACRSDFSSGQEYYKHIYEKHDKISKSCNECGRFYDSRKAFDEHIVSHYI